MDTIDDRQQHLRFDKLVAEDEVRAAIYRTLEELREILHRGSRLSSRHECLDEVSKLLFAHVTLVDRGEAGLSSATLPAGDDAALALSELVATTLRAGLPESLSHELDPSAYALRLQQSEGALAAELVRCFEELCPGESLRQMRRAGELDLLNDTFGQFLADSFSDEKELGQYLTPIEVVRFMVRLGLSSLSRDDLAALTDPTVGDEAGVILDPACGVGSFLAETVRALYARRRGSSTEAEREALVEHLMRSVMVGLDKSERMIRLCLTNLALFGAPSANLHLQSSLARQGAGAEVTEALVGRARLILTNPPFGAEFSGEALEPFKLFDGWARRRPRSIDSELLFLERYIDWLAPGGVLVAVVPDSILTNRGIYEDLRAGIAPGVEVLSVVSLPKATFGVAGTETKTSVLHLRKVEAAEAAARPTYFGICQSLGFDVSARGAQRKKVASGDNDLVLMSDEAARQARPRKGRLVDFSTAEARWDATYHAGLPLEVAKRLGRRGAEHLRVRDLAALVAERIDPREGEGKSFDYIEISGIDAESLAVRARAIPRSKAPSRARKPVVRGDVLVSTVRPERRTVGVVPPSLDGAVCSTGLAVLRCAEGVDPRVLARLLQSDFASAQILRNNVGIAYPAIDEACLAEIVLPAQAEALAGLAALAGGVARARAALDEAEAAFGEAVSAATRRWEA